MYSRLNTIDEILHKSIEKINLYDRNKYLFFFKLIESYIIDNNLIVGGDFANNLLEHDSIIHKTKFQLLKEIQSSVYEIYSEEPKDDAVKLVSILFNSDKDGIGRYSYVFPYIPNNIYQIYVNNRLLCIFKKLPIYRGVQIEKLITSQKIISLYSSNSFLCMGTYIQLINIYNNINNPNNAQNWNKLIYLEHKLRKLYLDSIDNKDIKLHQNEMLGDEMLGDKMLEGEILEENEKLEKKHLKLHQTHTHLELHHKHIKLHQDILNKYNLSFIYLNYLNNSNRIIIGDIGIYMLKHKNKTIHYNNIKNFRLQIITTNNLEDEGKLLSSVGIKHKIDIQWSISFPKYIDDFYLKRLTAYVMINGKKQTLLDMFNYGEYNLIGYNTIELESDDTNKKHLKFGSIYVLMRFRLIDEWIFNLLYELKSIPELYAKDMIKYVRNGYIELSKYFNTHLATDEQIILYISELEYIGIYKDINIELKRKKSQLSNIYSIYYPLEPTKYKLL